MLYMITYASKHNGCWFYDSSSGEGHYSSKYFPISKALVRTSKAHSTLQDYLEFIDLIHSNTLPPSTAIVHTVSVDAYPELFI